MPFLITKDSKLIAFQHNIILHILPTKSNLKENEIFAVIYQLKQSHSLSFFPPHQLFHIFIITKSSLFRAGITVSDICTLCDTEKQTINHLLFYCTESKAFWEIFTSCWYQRLEQEISLTESVILYRWHNNIKNKQALNVTLLIAKYHIFSTSSCNGKLSFDSFLLRLKNKIIRYFKRKFHC